MILFLYNILGICGIEKNKNIALNDLQNASLNNLPLEKYNFMFCNNMLKTLMSDDIL